MFKFKNSIKNGFTKCIFVVGLIFSSKVLSVYNITYIDPAGRAYPVKCTGFGEPGRSLESVDPKQSNSVESPEDFLTALVEALPIALKDVTSIGTAGISGIKHSFVTAVIGWKKCTGSVAAPGPDPVGNFNCFLYTFPKDVLLDKANKDSRCFAIASCKDARWLKSPVFKLSPGNFVPLFHLPEVSPYLTEENAVLMFTFQITQKDGFFAAVAENWKFRVSEGAGGGLETALMDPEFQKLSRLGDFLEAKLKARLDEESLVARREESQKESCASGVPQGRPRFVRPMHPVADKEKSASGSSAAPALSSLVWADGEPEDRNTITVDYGPFLTPPGGRTSCSDLLKGLYLSGAIGVQVIYVDPRSNSVKIRTFSFSGFSEALKLTLTPLFLAAYSNPENKDALYALINGLCEQEKDPKEFRSLFRTACLVVLVPNDLITEPPFVPKIASFSDSKILREIDPSLLAEKIAFTKHAVNFLGPVRVIISQIAASLVANHGAAMSLFAQTKAVNQGELDQFQRGWDLLQSTERTDRQGVKNRRVAAQQAERESRAAQRAKDKEEEKLQKRAAAAQRLEAQAQAAEQARVKREVELEAQRLVIQEREAKEAERKAQLELARQAESKAKELLRAKEEELKSNIAAILKAAQESFDTVEAELTTNGIIVNLADTRSTLSKAKIEVQRILEQMKQHGTVFPGKPIKGKAFTKEVCDWLQTALEQVKRLESGFNAQIEIVHKTIAQIVANKREKEAARAVQAKQETVLPKLQEQASSGVASSPRSRHSGSQGSATHSLAKTTDSLAESHCPLPPRVVKFGVFESQEDFHHWSVAGRDILLQSFLRRYFATILPPAGLKSGISVPDFNSFVKPMLVGQMLEEVKLEENIKPNVWLYKICSEKVPGIETDFTLIVKGTDINQSYFYCVTSLAFTEGIKIEHLPECARQFVLWLNKTLVLLCISKKPGAIELGDKRAVYDESIHRTLDV